MVSDFGATQPYPFQMLVPPPPPGKKDIDSKCANVATANLQFSILTANVQTRDFKNNLNKIIKGLESTNYIKSVKGIFVFSLFVCDTHTHTHTHTRARPMSTLSLADFNGEGVNRQTRTHSHQHTNTHT